MKVVILCPLYSPSPLLLCLAGLKVNNKPKSNASVERIAPVKGSWHSGLSAYSLVTTQLNWWFMSKQRIKGPQTRYETIKMVIQHFLSLCHLAWREVSDWIASVGLDLIYCVQESYSWKSHMLSRSKYRSRPESCYRLDIGSIDISL